MRKSRFTIIELLIVIAIIAILSGLLFAAIKAFMIKRDRTATKAAIFKIETAIVKYYQQYGQYPIANAEYSASALKILVDEKMLQIEDRFIKNEAGQFKIIDPWDQEISYIPANSYRDAENFFAANPGRPNLGPVKNNIAYYKASSFQIRSLGYDGDDDRGGPDDVSNIFSF